MTLEVEVRDGGVVAWFRGLGDAAYLNPDESEAAGNLLLEAAKAAKALKPVP